MAAACATIGVRLMSNALVSADGENRVSSSCLAKRRSREDERCSGFQISCRAVVRIESLAAAG